MRGSGIARVALACALFACGRTLPPPVAACAEILAERVPGARVVDHIVDADGAVLDYEVGSWWRRWEEPLPGRLVCAFEPGQREALRLRAATLAGVALTRAEVAVINADLLLAAMQRAGSSE